MAQTKAGPRTRRASASGQQPPKSLDDAIARVKAATAERDRARASGELPFRAARLIFDRDVKIPHHPHARLVQRGAIIATVAGLLGLIILPDIFLTHMLAFAALFALVLIGVPNLVLQPSGAIAPAKFALWCGILLLCGALTTVATGTDGSLWDWAPWLQQFYQHGASTAPPH